MGAKIILAAILVLWSAGATAQAGRYRLRDGPDVASEIRLSPDGRFEYALAAGALAEYASGRWRRDGRVVRLTTDPKPVAPVFSRGAQAKTEAAALRLHVTSPEGREMAGVDLRIEFDAGPPLADYIASDDGWNLPAEETRRPVALTLALPMFGLVSPRFPIDLAAGNELTFILTPNDLGRIDFQDTVLDIAPGKLVMHRGGGLLTYVRERR